jgi:hypothetical protein
MSDSMQDRDAASYDLPPVVVTRRRILFWVVFMYDGWVVRFLFQFLYWYSYLKSWQSLGTGRPPLFALAHVDCKLPDGSTWNITGPSAIFNETTVAPGTPFA